MSFSQIVPVAPFWGWTENTPALPEMYWNVYSAEQRIKNICCELHKLCEYANMLGESVNVDKELIKELQDAFKQFMESGFDDYYKTQVDEWIDTHFQTIMNSLLGKMVFFGLTDDGFFTAYIPEKWAFTFDTNVDYTSDDYGRLEIYY